MSLLSVGMEMRLGRKRSSSPLDHLLVQAEILLSLLTYKMLSSIFYKICREKNLLIQGWGFTPLCAIYQTSLLWPFPPLLNRDRRQPQAYKLSLSKEAVLGRAAGHQAGAAPPGMGGRRSYQPAARLQHRHESCIFSEGCCGFTVRSGEGYVLATCLSLPGLCTNRRINLRWELDAVIQASHTPGIPELLLHVSGAIIHKLQLCALKTLKTWPYQNGCWPDTVKYIPT